MNLNIGNDIIETKRIERLCKKFSKRFMNRVYTNKEIEYCESKGENKYQSYAARFAAKEAIFKAISNQLDNKYSIGWKDIEIINNEYGKPFANIRGVDFISNIDISMSHVKEYAIATALIVSK
ncbi:MAG: holo-ACP synthase [Clostridia bacterium]|nr:holo-ACP synthase [Clostridia bacterium]